MRRLRLAVFALLLRALVLAFPWVWGPTCKRAWLDGFLMYLRSR